jgi:RHS repeat-associated protein
MSDRDTNEGRIRWHRLRLPKTFCYRTPMDPVPDSDHVIMRTSLLPLPFSPIAKRSSYPIVTFAMRVYHRVGLAKIQVLIGLSALLLVTSLQAQNQEIQHFIDYKVQPDYWTFPGPTDTEVDAGGDLNLAIPVMTIPGRGLDYDVVFSYKSGITFSEPSNWIGLGWSFNPGSITREVEAIGRKDSRDVPFHYGVDLFDDSQAPRRAPDVYYVTIPGRGTFEMTQINVPTQTNTIPSFQQDDFIITDHQPWRIEATATGPVTVQGTCEDSACSYTTGLHRQGPNGGGFQTRTDISQFVVTVEDGTRYVFASPTLSTIDVPFHDEMPYLERQRYVSTWRLVSVLGANYSGPLVPTGTESGSWVRLTYGDVLTGTTTIQDHPFSPQVVQTQYLATITTPLRSASFSTVSRVEPNLPSHARNIQRRLQTIHQTQVETVVLSTTGMSPCGAQSCRTALSEIAFKGLNDASRPGYTFAYALNPSPLLTGSDIFNEFTDAFGYYKTPSPGSSANQGGHAWSLTSIVHPTGATDIITYETDHVATDALPYYNLSGYQEMYYVGTNRRWMGGARVTSITRSDGLGGESSSYFTYGPGRLSGIPPLWWQRKYPNWSTGGIRLASRSNRGSSGVFYEWIETIESDWSSTIRYYLTDSQVTTGTDIRPVRAVFDTRSRACEGILQDAGTAPVLCEDRYVLQSNDHWNWGRLFRTEVWGPEGRTRTENEEILASYKHNQIALSWGTPGQANHIPLVFGSSQKRFSRVTEGSWDVTTSYTYDNRTNQIREVREVLRSGAAWAERVRETTRAFDHYPEMQSRNMLSQVAREDVYEMAAGSPARYHASDVTTWERPSSRTFWVPKRTFSWLASQPTTVKATFSAWSSGSPSGWVQTSMNESFDAHGNVLERWDARGTRSSYAYGHNGSRVGFVTVHQGYATESDDIYLTLSYDNPWLKVSRICEASYGSCSASSGTNTWFGYDAFGRLHNVRNNAQDTLRTYQYAFSRTAAGSSIFDPSNPNVTTITRFLESGSSPSKSITRVFSDGLARSVQTQARIGSDYIVSGTDYDVMGRAVQHWKPYVDAASGGTYTSQFGARATTWYRNYLGLGYNPTPFSETIYQQDRTSRILGTVAEYTQQAHGVWFAYGTETIGGLLLRYEETQNEDGRRTRQYFDPLGRMVRSVEGYGSANAATTVLQYDILGNLTSVTQPEGQVWTYTYNTLSQLTQMTTPDVGTVRYMYDQGGLPRFTRENSGRVIFTTYDFAGRPVVSGVTSLSIAAFNSLTPSADEAFEMTTSNWRTVWRYNARPVSNVFPWSAIGTRMNGYPTNRVSTGRLAARAYRSGDQWQVELFSYDGDGRVVTKSLFTQDISARDSRYDYALDIQGRLTGRTVQMGGSTFRHWYDYDELDRLEKIFASTSSTKPATPDVEYTYHVSGQPASIRYQGQTQPLPHRYTIRDWLYEIGSPGSTLFDWWYSPFPFHARNRYSPSGNIDTLEVYQRHSPHTDKGYRYRLAYDDLGRLTSANYDRQTSGGFVTSSAYRVDNLTYDRNGNIQSLRRRNQSGTIIDNLTYAYASNRNRLIGVSDAAGATQSWDSGTLLAFTYDGNGNNIYYYDASRQHHHDMSYDEAGRVLAYEMDDEGTGSFVKVHYRYNASGQRYWKKSVLANPEYYVMDGSTALGYTHTNGLTDWNVLTPGGEAVGRQPHNNTRRYYVKDHLGSVRTVLTTSGSVVETRDYYPFGLHMPDRAWASSVEKAKEDFTGHELDTESGMIYAGARYYMPNIGRWTSVDPLAGEFPGWSPYNYGFNNPLSYVDPDGRAPVGKIVKLVKNVAQHGVNAGSLAMTVEGARQDLNTVFSSDASLLDRGLATVSLASEIASPVSLRDVRAGVNATRNLVRGADNAGDAVRVGVTPQQRGRISEQRVLNDMGEVKNTESIRTSHGTTIPDFQNSRQVGEIKDANRVNNTSQIRSQREAAQQSGRDHVIVTGTQTEVSRNAAQGSTVIRREDLGPNRQQ